MGTVCPSLTLISFRTPAAGDGISASTLSVEISKSGSSRSILSPGFFSHFVMVPSKILSPICGMMTSAMALSRCQTLRAEIPANIRYSVFCQVARGSGNFFRVRQKALFERRRIRHGRIERRDARNRPIQIFERAFADERRDFPGDAARARVLVNDQELVGFLH